MPPKKIACFCAISLALFLTHPAQATKNQIVYAAPSKLSAAAGKRLTLDILYTTNKRNANLTGLGLRVHFDSSKLAWAEAKAYENGLVGVDLAPVPDTDDFDHDPSTDKYYGISWVSLTGQWPGALPALLLNIKFDVNNDFKGKPTTKINFTSSSTAANHKFIAKPATIRLTK